MRTLRQTSGLASPWWGVSVLKTARTSEWKESALEASGPRGASTRSARSRGRRSRTFIQLLTAALMVGSVLLPSAMPASAVAPGAPPPDAPAGTIKAESLAASGAVNIALVALVAAALIPPTAEARLVLNEAAAVGTLRTLANAQSLFREGDKDHNGVLDYASSLTALGNANLIDDPLPSGEKQGYEFGILPSATTPNFMFGWAATAVPAVWGHTGSRSFYIDEAGVIRGASNCSIANSTSTPIGSGAPPAPAGGGDCGAGAAAFARAMRANESAAVGAMRTLVTAQSLFREGDKDKNGVLDYAQSTVTLGTYNLIDDQLASGDKNGYLFTIIRHPGYPDWQFGWAARAVPRVWGQTGDLSFYVDESGVIRFSTNCTLATQGSPPVGALPTDPFGGACSSSLTEAHAISVGMLSSLDIISNGQALLGAGAALRKGGDALLNGILIGLDIDGDKAISFQDLLENPSVLDQRFANMMGQGSQTVVVGQALAAGPLALSVGALTGSSASGSPIGSFFDIFTDYSNTMARALQLGVANEIVNFTVPFSSFMQSGASDALALLDDVPVLDHFKCYKATGPSANGVAWLQDEFSAADQTSTKANVKSPQFFCNPTTKVLPDGTASSIGNADGHLTGYTVTPDSDRAPSRTVAAYNQFGDRQVLTVGDADYLFVPTQKALVDGAAPATGAGAPAGLDHFQCYDVRGEKLAAQTVTLQDQFDAAANTGANVTVGKAVLLCNPTRKIHDDQAVGIGNAGGHLVCYEIKADAPKHSLVVNNQFGDGQKLTTSAAQMLCVPSVVRVPHANGAVLALFDALSAAISGLPKGALSKGQAEDFLGRLARAREDYAMGKVCAADTEMDSFLSEAAALRAAAMEHEGDSHNDDSNTNSRVPQSTDGGNGAEGKDGGKDNGNGDEDGSDGDHGNGGGDGKEGGSDDDEGSSQQPATVALAEDLFNRASAIRDSFSDSFFDVFFDIFVAPSHCFDASVGPQPQVHITQSDNTTFSASVAFGAPSLMTAMGGGETWTQVELPGLQALSGTPGIPAIPYWRALLAVPNGAQAGFLSPPEPAMPSGQGLHVNLYPFQMEPVDAANDNTSGATTAFTDPPFVKDATAYAVNAFLPPDPCKLTPMGQYRDLQMVQVICAVGKYNPVSDELRLYRSISFKVSFAGGNGTFITSRTLSPFESSPSLATDSVLNHDALSRFVQKVDISSLVCQGEELLILTHPDFASAANNLSVWKESKGIKTTVIEVGAGTSYTTGAKIDRLIEKRYDECLVRPSYVLLLGDAEFVPPSATDWNSSLPGGGGDPTTGSDWGYAVYVQTLFDAFFPDFAVARMPVNTAGQADTVVNKVIAYESNPPFVDFGSGGPFYTTAAFPSHFQCCKMNTDGTPLGGQPGTDQRAFVETAEAARNTLVAAGKSVERIYTETVDGGGYCTAAACPPGAVQSAYSGSTTPNRYFNGAVMPVNLKSGSGFAWDGSTADIVSAFNEGRFLIFHRDHGGPGGWGNPGFGTGNLASLNNSELLPFLYSVNCASGFWDQETDSGSTSESFMEQMLTKADGGMVGGLGDNRNSPTWANNALSRGFFDATWPNLAPEFGGSTSYRRLGDILNHGKMYMLTQLGVTQTAGSVDLDSALSELIMWHAFGDPTLEMWTANPHTLSLSTVFGLAVHGSDLNISYDVNGAQITVFRVTENGTVAYGRGVVIDHNLTIVPFVAQDTAPSAEDLLFSASLPNAVSVALTQASLDGSGNIGAPAAPAGWVNADATGAVQGEAVMPATTVAASSSAPSAAAPPTEQVGASAASRVEASTPGPIWQVIDDAKPVATPPATPVFAPTHSESHDFAPSAAPPAQTVAVGGDVAGAAAIAAGVATAGVVAIAGVLAFHFTKRPPARGSGKKSR